MLTIWAASKALEGSIRERVWFSLTALRKRRLFEVLMAGRPHTSLGRIMSERPKTIGILIWPYQCSAWEIEVRIARMVNHFGCADKIPALRFSVKEKLIIADLGHLSPGVRIILDQPEWLMREGSLALSIFKGNFRAYSVAFSLYHDQETSLFVGGVQGRDVDGVLDLYREITKNFHGLRPRDLLLELLRILAPVFEASRIFAVADRYRYDHHPYFGGAKTGATRIDYDKIWLDRGGIPIAPTHVELSAFPVRRRNEDIPPKKRNMYKKRYEMLSTIDQDVIASFIAPSIELFDAT